MRINAEELMWVKRGDVAPPIPAVERVTKVAETGTTYFGVRIFLKSPDELHFRPGDDDRSAITFWGPKVAEILETAAAAMRDGVSR